MYKGRLKETISYVAVKGVEQEYKPFAENEVKMMYNLQHPHILKFVNWYATTRHIWLILEYCTGGTLRDIIVQDRQLPDRCIAEFARPLCTALNFVHSKGIVHCDLKPSSILFDDTGVLKLSEFSFAQVANTHQTTASAGRRGSPYYMAPELFHDGDESWSYASDIWSLGCILYEMSCGQPPYVNRDISQLMSALLDGTEPPRLHADHTRSADLVDLVAKCLCKDVNERATWRFIMEHPFWGNQRPEYSHTMLTDDRPAVAATTTADTSTAAEAGRMRRTYSNEDLHRFSTNAYRNDDEDTGVVMDVSGHVRMGNDGWDKHLNFNDAALTPKAGKKRVTHIHTTAVPPTPSDLGIVQYRPRNADDDDDDGVYALTPASSPSAPRAQSAAPNSRSSDPYSPVRITPSAATELQPRVHRAKTASIRNQPSADDSTQPQQQDDRLKTLVVDASDLVVHPLVDNPRIEKVLATTAYDPSVLPFDPLTAEDVLEMSTNDSNTYLEVVVHAMDDETKQQQCESVLLYAQSLCRNQAIATALLNSGVHPLIIRALNTYTTPVLKEHMLHLIGVEVRYASTINPSIEYTGIVSALCDHVRHDHVAVRRWAVAALGEFLFYVSIEARTQQWSVDASTFQLIAQCLRDDEDHLVQHYAVKTIENICAHTGPLCSVFCEPYTLEHVLQIYTTTTRSSLRRISASVLFQFAYRSVRMMQLIVDALGSNGIHYGLSDRSMNIQRAFLNLLNIMLLHKRHVSRGVLIELVASKSLLPRLLSLADNHQSPIVRAKVVITLCLIGNTDLAWFYRCTQHKCLALLERIRPPSSQSSLPGVACLRAAIAVFIDHSIAWSSRVLRACMSIVKQLLDAKYASVPLLKIYRRSVVKFKVFGHFLMSDLTRHHVVSAVNIHTISQLLGMMNRLLFSESLQWKRSILSTVESLSMHQPLLRAHANDVIQRLLPALASLLSNPSAELRFTALKVLNDVLVRMLRDHTIYGSHEHQQHMNAFITDDLLSRFLPLLQDSVPIPQYCLKLLHELAETNDGGFVMAMHNHALTPQLLILFAPFKNNSVYNVNLIRHMVLCTSIDNMELCDRGLLRQLHVVMEYAIDHSISWYYQPLLDIVHNLLFAMSTRLLSNGDNTENADDILAKFEPMMKLVPLLYKCLDASYTADVRDSSTQCLLLLLRLYGNTTDDGVNSARVRLLLNCVSNSDTAQHTYHALKLLSAYNTDDALTSVLLSDTELANDMTTIMDSIASDCLTMASPSMHAAVATGNDDSNQVRVQCAQLANKLELLATNISYSS